MTELSPGSRIEVRLPTRPRIQVEIPATTTTTVSVPAAGWRAALQYVARAVSDDGSFDLPEPIGTGFEWLFTGDELVGPYMNGTEL